MTSLKNALLILSGLFILSLNLATSTVWANTEPGIKADLKIQYFLTTQEQSPATGQFHYQGNKTHIKYQPALDAGKIQKKKKKKKNRRNQARKNSKKESASQLKQQSQPSAKKSESLQAQSKTQPKAKPQSLPNPKVYFVDHKAAEATYYFPQKKKYLKINLNTPRTWEQNFWQRFLKEGGIVFDVNEFKKRNYQAKLVKKTKFQGYRCDVWQLKHKVSGLAVEFWAAKDLKEIPLKLITRDTEGRMTIATLSNIQKTPIESNLFQYPKGFSQYQPKITEVGSTQEFIEAKEKEIKAAKAAKRRSKK